MEVKKGCKQTEVGVIPDDWNVIPIGKIFEFKNGLNKAKGYFGKGTPIVNYMDVFNNPGLFKQDVNGKVTLTVDEIRNYQVKKGDVFFTRTSETVDEIGMSAVLLDNITDAVFSGFVLRGRPKNDILDLLYKQYCFRSKEVRKQICSTSSYTTRALTNGKLLSNVYIAVPPTKAEQTAIATALSDADALIQSLGKLIAKKRNIKQGAMQELLTGKKRLTGFEEDWQEYELNELGIFKGGSGFPTKYQGLIEGKFPFYKVSDMNIEGNEVFMSNSNNYINEDIKKLINTFIFPKNTIVFAKIGAAVFLERKKILTKESCIDNNMMGFILNASKCDINFFHSLFLSIKLSKLVSTTALPSLNGKEIGQLKFKIPKPDEQTRIAAILSDMDAEIAALETKLAKYKQIKQGMMQELLTGRTRLV